MKLDEVKAVARHKRIKAGRLTKKVLVRTIQIEEGNCPCFGTNTSQVCGQKSCLWREYCD